MEVFSIRIYVKKGKNIKIKKNVRDLIKEEENLELKILKLIRNFRKRSIK